MPGPNSSPAGGKSAYKRQSPEQRQRHQEMLNNIAEQKTLAEEKVTAAKAAARMAGKK